jgi:hypothetical protein
MTALFLGPLEERRVLGVREIIRLGNPFRAGKNERIFLRALAFRSPLGLYGIYVFVHCDGTDSGGLEALRGSLQNWREFTLGAVAGVPPRRRLGFRQKRATVG